MICWLSAEFHDLGNLLPLPRSLFSPLCSPMSTGSLCLLIGPCVGQRRTPAGIGRCFTRLFATLPSGAEFFGRPMETAGVFPRTTVSRRMGKSSSPNPQTTSSLSFSINPLISMFWTLTLDRSFGERTWCHCESPRPIPRPGVRRSPCVPPDRFLPQRIFGARRRRRSPRALAGRWRPRHPGFTFSYFFSTSDIQADPTKNYADMVHY
ncbi:hypothetical protein SEVIR_8G087033v4 [Setaria viridis]